MVANEITFGFFSPLRLKKGTVFSWDHCYYLVSEWSPMQGAGRHPLPSVLTVRKPLPSSWQQQVAAVAPGSLSSSTPADLQHNFPLTELHQVSF